MADVAIATMSIFKKMDLLLQLFFGADLRAMCRRPSAAKTARAAHALLREVTAF